MPVKAEKAIQFRCEFCRRFQFVPYSLEPEYFKGREVFGDKIDCEFCGKENHVIEEL